MHHYLVIDACGGFGLSDTSAETWRIPDGADPNAVLQVLREAMASGEVIGISVQTSDERDVKLVFNGKAVGTVAVISH